MQYSNTTTKDGLIQDCEFWTNLADAGISSNATLLAKFNGRINSWYHKVVTMILESQDEWDYDDSNHTDFPILTTNLVASQQDYAIPVSEKVFKVKRVEVTYDGTNWYKAEPMDINERGLATDTTSIAGAFSTSQPKYDIQYESIFLYPIPSSDVTAGLKIWWTREVDEFVVGDTIQEPGIDEPFHRMLSIGASYDWLIVNKPENTTLITRLEGLLADYEARLKRHYGSKQKDRQYTLKSAYVNYE